MMFSQLFCWSLEEVKLLVREIHTQAAIVDWFILHKNSMNLTTQTYIVIVVVII